jgi:hypothetical protein
VCTRVTLVAMVLAALVLVESRATLASDEFPPFITEPERLPPAVRREVSDIWKRRTVMRVARGESTRVPLDLYTLFVDLPEVTAAAGRHLGVGAYQITRRGPDAYAVADSEGAHGDYRVIAKAPGQRVLVARLERTVRLLGDVRGAALTSVALSERRDDDGRAVVTQRVETVARIDHRVAAVVARILVPLFPSYADRKIGEVFHIAARVAEWSVDDPAEFCRWLAAEPEVARQRALFAAHIGECRGAAVEPLH